jgi:hypothetical protein
VLNEAGHDAGMSAQHENKPHDDDPADSPAHRYRSCDAVSIPLLAAIRAATITARCSLLARVAFVLETTLMQANILKLLQLVFPPRTAAMRP